MKKCDICDEREATVHVTDVFGAEKREMHLCEQCSQQKLAPLAKVVELGEMLKSLLQGALDSTLTDGQTTCPSCGMSMAEFRASGRFGCPNGYRAFEGFVKPLLEKIQHAPRHVGKVPARVGGALQRENELIRLRRDLERAVQREEYEQAARIRDRIRMVSGRQEGPNGTV